MKKKFYVRERGIDRIDMFLMKGIFVIIMFFLGAMVSIIYFKVPEELPLYWGGGFAILGIILCFIETAIFRVKELDEFGNED